MIPNTITSLTMRNKSKQACDFLEISHAGTFSQGYKLYHKADSLVRSIETKIYIKITETEV
jgi:hypothetical protein